MNSSSARLNTTPNKVLQDFFVWLEKKEYKTGKLVPSDYKVCTVNTALKS